MKKFANIIFLSISCLIVIPGTLLLNDVYKNIRMMELKKYLQQMDRTEKTIDHMTLVATYNLHKQMYHNSLTREDADSLEFKMNLLISKRKKYRSISLEKYRLLSVPALIVINVNRSFMGKAPIRFEIDNVSLLHLDSAYFFERNNKYQKAVEIYDDILLTENPDKSIKASIILHKGFCYAMIEDFQMAKKNYFKVINDYSDEYVAITAAILLRYLDGFSMEQEKILQTADSLEKSEKLYRLLAYKEALKVINNIKGKVSKKKLDHVNYLTARCHEELGNSQKSVNSYLKTIAASPKSNYAKLSNRRLFIMGATMGNKTIRNLAVQSNKFFKDTKLKTLIAEESNNFDMLSKIGTKNYIVNNEIEKFKLIKISDNLLNKVKRLTTGHVQVNYIGKNVEIATKDGNIFKGTVADMKNSIIILKTNFLGIVNIETDRIHYIKIVQ